MFIVGTEARNEPAAAPTRASEPTAPECFINRELSWFDFARRVLALAGNDSLPLGPRGALFAEIARGDILLHLPYHDFDTSVSQLIENAARDPKARATKTAIYRTEETFPDHFRAYRGGAVREAGRGTSRDHGAFRLPNERRATAFVIVVG